MIDPVSGRVLPNGLQDVAALGMTQHFNPFLDAGAMVRRPMPVGEGIPIPADGMAATSGMAPTMAPTAAPPAQQGGLGAAFGGRIPQGLLGALLRLSQRNPAMFDQRLAGPLAERFGITPEMVQNYQPTQRFGGGGGGFGGNFAPAGGGGNFAAGIGLQRDGGGFNPAQMAQQSQLAPEPNKARNQNIGSAPAAY